MAVERAAGGTSLIDVLDRVLDKGIVIDAWVRVSLVGIDLITVEARVVVASIDTYLKYSEAVVLVSEGLSNEMLLVAEHGISSGAIMDFSLNRDDGSHPLIQALNSPSPVYVNGLAAHFRVPLEADGFHVIPLRAEATEPGHGLLLVSGGGSDLDPETAWLGRTLGKQVSRLLGRQLLAETRFEQERMLLYSIINAVTDPILLTDTEGKLIIANSHAEKLFAAPEEASEGWRRAASLNNMLFSAALSTSAVGMSEMARRELLLVDPLEGSDLLFELLSSRPKDERQGPS